MNKKQYFMMLHSAVAIVSWGVMASVTRQILPCLLGALISVGIVILVINRLERNEPSVLE